MGTEEFGQQRHAFLGGSDWPGLVVVNTRVFLCLSILGIYNLISISSVLIIEQEHSHLPCLPPLQQQQKIP